MKKVFAAGIALAVLFGGNTATFAALDNMVKFPPTPTYWHGRVGGNIYSWTARKC